MPYRRGKDPDLPPTGEARCLKMQPDQESTDLPPRPPSLAAMSPLGWFAVVPEMVASEARRARRLEPAVRREARENVGRSLWRNLRVFARRLASAGGLGQEGCTIARNTSPECTPRARAQRVTLATPASEIRIPAPASPQPGRDKSVSPIGFLRLRRAAPRPSWIPGGPSADPAPTDGVSRHRRGRSFSGREERSS